MHRCRSINTTALILAAVGGMTGCSDSRAPSEEAFRAALAPIVRDVFCVFIDVMPFDVEGQDGNAVFPIVTASKRELAGPGSDGRSVAMLDALAGVGLVTRKEVERRAKWKGSDRPFAYRPLLSYAPTDKGAPYLRAIDRKATRGTVSVPAICAARGEVVDVVRWSEPADVGGRRVSQVTYSYRGVDPIPVMSEAERTRLAEPREVTASLELQSDGWRPMPR